MKFSSALAAAFLTLSLASPGAQPQQQGSFGGPRGGFGGQGGRGGPDGRPGGGQDGFRPPPHPILTAIDVNNNYTIEAAEIASATRNLLKLDRNKDGQLTSDETEPGPPGGGQFGGPGGGRGGQTGFGGPRGGSQGPQRGGARELGGPTERGGSPSPQGRGGPGGGPPPHPLGEAIDTDHDGTLSKTELAGAAAALKKLDTDGDGSLSHHETRPKHGGGPPGQGEQGGQFGGPRGGSGSFGGEQRSGPDGRPSMRRGGPQSSFGGPPQSPSGGFGAPKQPQGGFGAAPSTKTNDPVDRLMSLDKNGDGKVSRSEIPKNLSRLSQADKNGDGYISRAEAATFVNSLRSGRAGQPSPTRGQQRPDFEK